MILYIILARVQRSCDTQLSAHPISMVGQNTAALSLVTGLVFRLTWKQRCLQSSLALTFDLIEPSVLGLKDHSYLRDIEGLTQRSGTSGSGARCGSLDGCNHFRMVTAQNSVAELACC